MAIKSLIKFLLLFLSLPVYSSTIITKQIGAGLVEYHYGWKPGGIRPSTPSPPFYRKPALSLSFNIEHHQAGSKWYYGVGGHLSLLNLQGLQHSNNGVDFSLLRLGYQIFPKYIFYGNLGTTLFFENEISLGTSLGFELKTPWSLYNKTVSFRFQYAQTDYEIKSQSTSLKGATFVVLDAMFNW